MKVPTMLVRSAGQLLGLCAHEAAASRRDSILISSAASLATLPWAGPGSQSREDQVVASSRLEYFPGSRAQVLVLPEPTRPHRPALQCIKWTL